MAQDQTNSADVLIALAPGTGALRHRLEEAILGDIASGRLAPGTALPPSRTLADALGLSRWVVTEAYGHLVGKGVLEARTGSATRVAAVAPGGALGVGPGESLVEPVETRSAVRGPGLERAPDRATHDLAPGVPDLRHVPREAWLRAAREALAEASNQDLGTQPPAGHPAARAAVATHLRRSRIVSGPDDAVVLTRGAADGMSRIAAALADAGHTHLLVEDPSWPALRDVAEAAGLTPVPVPVDDDGISPARLRAEAARTGARAALLTPAHQFPLGAALSDERRAALLDWAREVDGLLIEDDYDAEFRYDRRPVPALQGLDPDRVLLLGSTSKTLAPAFGIGWMVVPRRWRAAVLDVSVRRGPTPGPATLDQLTLARFVGDGSYARHLRSARARYARRRTALLDALGRELPGAVIGGIAAGMHVTVDLAGLKVSGVHAGGPDLAGLGPAGPGPRGLGPAGLDLTGSVAPDAAAVVREGAARDVALVDLRRYQAVPSARSTVLVVGYGNLADARLPAAIRSLRAAVEAASSSG
ncbi:aminotransferase-like domain-containing protein [Promicromonospora sukumoe]|uniref:GntR family transcriptional regulator/MocR family aminotransferase n=1 Tax=Promicromonospora sukumoe TaxID=88382 RepID=A0A7W3JCS5_9MICO|nr:PLP-dependent aminotransferase family protein [Promicromonospora sukumoe]MBA8810444.1 GntR family transcriptional regulator/MocR family aminotransferase [Promicromonospora sukumoe]